MLPKLKDKLTEISSWLKPKDLLMTSKLLMKLLRSSSKNSKVLMISSETNNTMMLVLLMTTDSPQECSVELVSKKEVTPEKVDGMPLSKLDFDHCDDTINL